MHSRIEDLITLNYRSVKLFSLVRCQTSNKQRIESSPTATLCSGETFRIFKGLKLEGDVFCHVQLCPNADGLKGNL
jgi:hypothetical protein